MIDPYVCIGTPYRPRLLIIIMYGIFLNEISRRAFRVCVFMMAYAGLWLLQNIQRVLIAEPMSVLAAKMDGDEYRSYVSGTAVAQTGSR